MTSSTMLFLKTIQAQAFVLILMLVCAGDVWQANARAVFWRSSWIRTPPQRKASQAMEQDTASGSRRPERPGRRSGSHKGKQVTVAKTVLQCCISQPKGLTHWPLALAV